MSCAQLRLSGFAGARMPAPSLGPREKVAREEPQAQAPGASVGQVRSKSIALSVVGQGFQPVARRLAKSTDPGSPFQGCFACCAQQGGSVDGWRRLQCQRQWGSGRRKFGAARGGQLLEAEEILPAHSFVGKEAFFEAAAR